MVKTFFGSMDHSVSEQLTGQSSLWHTSVVVLSENGQHLEDLANSIGRMVNPRTPGLKKWKKTKNRRKYLAALGAALRGSEIIIFAISATEDCIVHNENLLISELGLRDLCAEETTPAGKTLIKIGPYTDRRSGADHFFKLSKNRALMILWIAHFVARAHQQMEKSLKTQHADLFSLDWFLYIDKFAGDNVGQANGTQLFQTLVQRSIMGAGNIRVAFFNDSGTVSSDLLADNIAGLFNEYKTKPATYPDLSHILANSHIHWESN